MVEKEYIERKAVLEYMSKVKEACLSIFEYKVSAVIGGMIGEIEDDEIPSSDVTPVVHGCWAEKKLSGVGGVWDHYFICSMCGGSTPNKAYVIAPDFCPNCGAKMDGKEVECEAKRNA